MTRLTPGRSASQPASRSAFAEAACTRRVSVARPRSASQQSNGPDARPQMPTAWVAGIDLGGLDAVAAEFLAEELGGPAVQAVAGDDAVALLEQRQEDAADGRHAGAADDGPGGALQFGDAVGQVAGVGVGVAGVDE